MEDILYYDELSRTMDNLFRVKKNDKWGVLDKHHILVIPCIYDSITHLYKDMFLTIKDNIYNIQNASDKSIVIGDCENIVWIYNSDQFIITVDKKIHIINLLSHKDYGVSFLKCTKDLNDIKMLENGDYIVNIGEKYGIVDKDCKFIIEPIFNSITWNDDHEFYTVKIDFFMTLLKKDGEIMMPLTKCTDIIYHNRYFVSYKDENKISTIYSLESGQIIKDRKYDQFLNRKRGYHILKSTDSNGTLYVTDSNLSYTAQVDNAFLNANKGHYITAAMIGFK